MSTSPSRKSNERRSPSARSREGNHVSLTSSLLQGSPRLTRRSDRRVGRGERKGKPHGFPLRPFPRSLGRGSPMSGRRAARRTALFLLYQWDVTGQPLASLYEGEVDPFARELAESVAAQADELDERLSAASEGWPADRLGALERNVLRIGIFELDRGEVPVEVAIDEAVTLAKRYASDEAGRLVNGILGRIAQERAA